MSCEEWEKVRLGDVIIFNPRENLKKGRPSKKITMDKLLPKRRIVSGYEDSIFHSGSKFRNGDVLFARITPCLENGKTAKVTILEDGEIAFGSTEFIVFRNTPGSTDVDFVYYLAISPELREIAIQSMVGSSGRQRVQLDVIEDSCMSLPAIDEQKAIAQTLSCLDEKIELNNRINQVLEEMAEAIFKSWFIDFEPFQDSEFIDSELGPIPQGWKAGVLGDLVDYIKCSQCAGKHLRNMRYVPIECIPTKSLGLEGYRPGDVAKSSLISFKKNDILIGSMRVYFHRVVLAPFDGITRTTCFVLRPKDINTTSFSLLLCNQANTIDYARRTSKGTTMPYAVWDNGLREMSIVLPPKEVVHRFEDIIFPVLTRIRDSIFENLSLMGIRDVLLPKLISGDIRVPFKAVE